MDINLRDPCLILHHRGKESENSMKSQTRVTSINLQNTENVYSSEEFEGVIFVNKYYLYVILYWCHSTCVQFDCEQGSM